MSAQPQLPDPRAIDLSEIDVSRPELMQQDVHWDYFARLREEAPIHYCSNSAFGPYWSVTRFRDIMEI